MPAELPPLPTEGGSYDLAADGSGWVVTQQTQPAAATAPDPVPTPDPEATDAEVQAEPSDPGGQ